MCERKYMYRNKNNLKANYSCYRQSDYTSYIAKQRINVCNKAKFLLNTILTNQS